MKPSDRRRSPGSWVVSVTILVCGICLLMLQGAAGGKISNVAEVRLGHGLIGDYHWAVFASRQSSSGSPERACLTATSGAVSEGARTSGFTLCGQVTEGTQVLVAKSDGVGRAQRTVLGMAFPRHVRSVRLWLRGKRSRRIWLKALSPRQAAAAGLIRFRYATDAFAGPFCLHRFASYGVSGERLRISSRMGCPK